MMEKKAQEFGLLGKFRQAINLGGIWLEVTDTDFKDIMKALSENDDATRKILLDANLKSLLKEAQSKINRREYFLALESLVEFNRAVQEACSKLDAFTFNLVKDLNVFHNQILTKHLSPGTKRKLVEHYKSQKKAELEKELELIKVAGILDSLLNIITPRGRALRSWEKRFPEVSKDLRNNTNKLLSASNSLYSKIISEFKKLGEARIGRKLEDYIKASNTLVNAMKQYNSDFNNHYLPSIEKYRSSLEDFGAEAPPIAGAPPTPSAPGVPPAPPAPAVNIPSPPMFEAFKTEMINIVSTLGKEVKKISDNASKIEDKHINLINNFFQKFEQSFNKKIEDIKKEQSDTTQSILDSLKSSFADKLENLIDSAAKVANLEGAEKAEAINNLKQSAIDVINSIDEAKDVVTNLTPPVTPEVVTPETAVSVIAPVESAETAVPAEPVIPAEPEAVAPGAEPAEPVAPGEPETVAPGAEPVAPTEPEVTAPSAEIAEPPISSETAVEIIEDADKLFNAIFNEVESLSDDNKREVPAKIASLINQIPLNKLDKNILNNINNFVNNIAKYPVTSTPLTSDFLSSHKTLIKNYLVTIKYVDQFLNYLSTAKTETEDDRKQIIKNLKIYLDHAVKIQSHFSDISFLPLIDILKDVESISTERKIKKQLDVIVSQLNLILANTIRYVNAQIKIQENSIAAQITKPIDLPESKIIDNSKYFLLKQNYINLFPSEDKEKIIKELSQITSDEDVKNYFKDKITDQFLEKFINLNKDYLPENIFSKLTGDNLDKFNQIIDLLDEGIAEADKKYFDQKFNSFFSKAAEILELEAKSLKSTNEAEKNSIRETQRNLQRKASNEMKLLIKDMDKEKYVGYFGLSTFDSKLRGMIDEAYNQVQNDINQNTQDWIDNYTVPSQTTNLINTEIGEIPESVLNQFNQLKLILEKLQEKISSELEQRKMLPKPQFEEGGDKEKYIAEKQKYIEDCKKIILNKESCNLIEYFNKVAYEISTDFIYKKFKNNLSKNQKDIIIKIQRFSKDIDDYLNFRLNIINNIKNVNLDNLTSCFRKGAQIIKFIENIKNIFDKFTTPSSIQENKFFTTDPIIPSIDEVKAIVKNNLTDSLMSENKLYFNIKGNLHRKGEIELKTTGPDVTTATPVPVEEEDNLISQLVAIPAPSPSPSFSSTPTAPSAVAPSVPAALAPEEEKVKNFVQLLPGLKDILDVISNNPLAFLNLYDNVELSSKEEAIELFNKVKEQVAEGSEEENTIKALIDMMTEPSTSAPAASSSATVITPDSVDAEIEATAKYDEILKNIGIKKTKEKESKENILKYCIEEIKNYNLFEKFTDEQKTDMVETLKLTLKLSSPETQRLVDALNGVFEEQSAEPQALKVKPSPKPPETSKTKKVESKPETSKIKLSSNLAILKNIIGTIQLTKKSKESDKEFAQNVVEEINKKIKTSNEFDLLKNLKDEEKNKLIKELEDKVAVFIADMPMDNDRQKNFFKPSFVNQIKKLLKSEK